MAVIEISAADFPGTALSGSGTDTLKLVGGGTFDFAYVTFAGFSHIECEGGTIKISGTQLTGVSSVSSSDYTSVYLSGSAIDLRGKTFNNVNNLFIDEDDAIVTVGNLPLALRLKAFGKQGETIVLDGPVTTPASRKDLHNLGFDTIVQGEAEWTDETPILTGLATTRLQVREGNSVLLDPEGDCVVSDAEGPLAYLDIVLSGSGYYYPMSNFEFDEQFEITSDFFDGQRLFCNGTEIARIDRIEFGDGAQIVFNASATQEIIQDFVRSLAFAPGDFVYYEDVTISITARDKGGRKAEALLHVTAENDWTPTSPTLIGRTVAENAAAGTVVGTLNATDANGDPIHYVLTDNAGGRFKIVGDKLVVSGNAAIDFEQAAKHMITVVANDGGQNGIASTFTITVSDVAEAVPGEKLSGGRGKDTLTGHAGNDTIAGGLGNDILWGAGGSDIFAFNTKPGKANIDRIMDFAPRGDKISLENAVFKKLGKAGVLKKGFFHIGASAHDQDDRVIYNSKNGALYYDQDGTGALKAVQFATLAKKLALKYTDFIVI